MKKSLILCLLIGSFATLFSQQRTVTGTVTDSAGESLIGVSVMIENTITGTITNINGNYSILAQVGQKLVFSYVGMETQRVVVTQRELLNITMKENAIVLNETVVIGYGSAKKRDLTGTIASVKGTEVADRPSSNPISSIQGKIAGVQIVNSGRAGAEPDIRIRGTNSINGVSPLYIVDGLFNDNINFLNPADIESMEILKDPSSLAIFGVRGANGVIIVTTKTAKEGKVVVNVNSTVGLKHVADKMKLTNAPQFIELYNEQRLNQSITAPYDYTNWQANTDWQDEIFQTGFFTYDNVSISGATEKSKIYMGLGYMYEEGVIKKESMDKISLNFNSEYNVTKNLKFGFQLNGYMSNPTNGKNVSAAILAAPIASAFNSEYGLYNTMPDFQRSQVWNPMIDVDLKSNTYIPTEYRVAGSVYGDWKFLKNFNFRAAFFADYGFNQSRSYSPLISVFNPDIVLGNQIAHLVEETSISQSKNVYTKLQSDFLLTYTTQIEDHGLTLTGGFTTYYNAFTETSASRLQYKGSPIPNDPKYWYLSIGDPSEATNASGQWETSTASLLLRGLYNYKNRYLLNASIRRDGASYFSYNNKTWQNFGAVGLAWVMTEEDFMKQQSLFDYLKLKGSWGLLGSQNIDPAWRYPGYPEMQNSSTAIFGDQVYPGYTPKYLPDPNLQWERIYSWEVGLDAYTLKNRLHIEATYFSKKTKGFLAIVPGISGTVPGLSNLGDIENNGVELSSTWSDKIGDWSYSISGNLTTLSNRVLNYENTIEMSRTASNYPIAYFYGYKSIGIYQTYAEIAQAPESKIGQVRPGDIRFADINRDGKITTADRTMIGNPTPDFTYGGSFTIGYKGIDLTIDLMGVYGNEIFRNWNRNTYAQFNYQIERMDRWNGVGSSNKEPILSNERTNNTEISSYYIEDGSFFRIRNIQLGYNFNQKLLKSMHMQGLRLFLNAQNPITLKNNTGYTPEIGGSSVQFGVDNGSYPMPVIYSFGINLTF